MAITKLAEARGNVAGVRCGQALSPVEFTEQEGIALHQVLIIT